MAVRQSFYVDFKATTRGLARGVGRATRQLRRVSVGVAKIGTAVAGIGVAAGTAGAAKSITRLTELHKVAAQIRGTPAMAQLLSSFSKIKSVELDHLAEVIQEIQRNVGENQGAKFSALGLDINAFKRMKDPIEMLSTFIDKVKNLSESRKVAGLGAFLGEDLGLGLANALRPDDPKATSREKREGSAAATFKRLRDQQESTTAGLKLTALELDKIREKWVMLHAQLEAYGLKVAEKLLPHLKQIVPSLDGWIREQGGIDKLARQTADAIRDTVAWVKGVVSGISDAHDQMVKLYDITLLFFELGKRIKDTMFRQVDITPGARAQKEAVEQRKKAVRLEDMRERRRSGAGDNNRTKAEEMLKAMLRVGDILEGIGFQPLVSTDLVSKFR